MDPSRWKRISELFAEARLLAAEHRLAFLQQKCEGDQGLIDELQSLLKIDSDHGLLDSELTTCSLGVPTVIAGRFRIVRYIAEGGMGTVYEAEDLRLNDRVALKTIRPDIASDPNVVERFKREILLGKKVTHPNVCRIHDLGIDRSDDGKEVLFLTMQFLNGETLAARIRRGPIDKAEALPLIEDMIDALSAAHAVGVIHRDFKSGNVMLVHVTGGDRHHAVVTDFGLARSVQEHAPLTRAGMIGTVEYMAPEQIKGEEVTPATDVYALGIVMYEMTTGQRPFDGDSKVTIALRQLNDSPRPPRALVPDLDPRWEETILACLHKAPSERFHSAAEVRAALLDNNIPIPVLPSRLRKNGLSRASLLGIYVLVVVGVLVALLRIPAIGERARGILFASGEKHIAVLPLDFSTGSPETQALGDGLMDSLAGKLSNLDSANKSLWVVPASQVRSSKVNDPSSALREFGATMVVTGTFEHRDDITRLKLTLIDSRKMREIGFVDVANENNDLAALQDQAVAGLGRLMNISVGAQSVNSVLVPPTHAAYRHYLTARGYMQRYDKTGNLDLAIADLQESVRADDRFGLGFAELCEAYRLKYELDRDSHWLSRAAEYCDKALDLDAHLSPALVSLAKIHEFTGQRDLAISEFKEALSTDSVDADALNGLAHAYESSGHVADAEAAFEKAAALRPDFWDGYNELGNFYDRQGRFAEAIAQYRKALHLTPDNAQLYANLGATYMDWGNPTLFPEAADALNHSLALNSKEYYVYANLGFLYGFQQKYAEAAAVTEKALELNGNDWRVWANLIILYDRLERKDKLEAARKKALDLVEQTVRLEPQNSEAQSVLATLYARANKRSDAVSRIRTALALSPDNPQVLSNVAEAYALLNEQRLAVTYLRKAIQKGQNRFAVAEDPRLQNLNLRSAASAVAAKQIA